MIGRFFCWKNFGFKGVAVCSLGKKNGKGSTNKAQKRIWFAGLGENEGADFRVKCLEKVKRKISENECGERIGKRLRSNKQRPKAKCQNAREEFLKNA
jgi:hypothetical protein